MESSETTAKVWIEQIEHPERFCKICGKRIPICKHYKRGMKKWIKSL